MGSFSTARAYAASTEAPAAKPAGAAGAGPRTSTKGRNAVDARSNMESEAVSEAPEAKPGSQPVLMSEVRYGVVFGEMNEVFNARMNGLLVFIITLCGLLSVGGFTTNLTKVLPQDSVLWLSIGLAVLTAIAHASKVAFKFKEREAEFRIAKKAFQDLEGRGWSMNQGTLYKELAKLRGAAPAGGAWLASAAFNKACAELGYPERHRDMPKYVRFIAARVG